MKGTALFIAGLMAGIMTASTAQAACVQADAAGRWTVYSSNSDDYVTRCIVAVNSSGNIASTYCTAFYGSSSYSVPLSGGRITLADATRCAYRGSITFAGTVNTIRDMSLAPGKGSAQGIGTYPGGTFLMSMTRY